MGVSVRLIVDRKKKGFIFLGSIRFGRLMGCLLLFGAMNSLGFSFLASFIQTDNVLLGNVEVRR